MRNVGQPSAPPLNSSAPANAPKPRASWILVDDDEEPLQFLANSLEIFDLAEVHQFRHPSKALTAFAAAPSQFELVITDLNMPGMSGIELCRRLHRVSNNVKVILTSAGPIDTQRFATEAGFSAFLSKPFPATALWRTLESVLGNFPPADGKRVLNLNV